jgi:hypothetical protein
MLTEPIVLQRSTTDQTGAVSLSRVDTDNGRSVYRYNNSGVTHELTISNTVTKENPPYKTDRILVRYDQIIPSTGNPVIETKSSVYVVIATPRGDGAGQNSTLECVNAMLRFLGQVSGTPSGVTNATSLASAQTLVGRLMNGET